MEEKDIKKRLLDYADYLYLTIETFDPRVIDYYIIDIEQMLIRYEDELRSNKQVLKRKYE